MNAAEGPLERTPAEPSLSPSATGIGAYVPCPVCSTYCYGRHDHPLIEAVDYPVVGERVAYTKGDGTGTVLAYVERVAAHDGDVDLRFTDGQAGAVDVKPGRGERHTYRRIDVPLAPSARTDEVQR